MEEENINQKYKPVDYLSSYKCQKCSLVPLIQNINYHENTITINCPIHKTQILSINDYLNKSSQDNNLCFFCGKNKPSKFCFSCDKYLCSTCNHENSHILINLNEFNIYCKTHKNKKYSYYCENCNENLCDECSSNHDETHNSYLLSNKISNIKEDIEYIKNKNKEFEKIIQNYKNYIKINNMILQSYEKLFLNNYTYIINLKNLARFLKNFENDNKSINKMQFELQIQNNLIENFNNKYKSDIKNNQEVIYLNWKNTSNEGLLLLSQINFSNLKELQLCGTELSDISPLEKVEYPQLQELYLTDNKISDISVLEKVNFPNLQILYLNKNNIDNFSVFTKVKFIMLHKLFLNNNNIKDISSLDKTPLENLQIINLSRNKIKDIKVLNELKYKWIRLINIKKNEVDYNLKENVEIINNLRDKTIRIIY